MMMIQLPMICTCSLDGFEQAEARRMRIFNKRGLTNPAELTTVIILSLAFEFGAQADVAADMWFDVGVLTDQKSVYVQCDHPCDGLAAIWEHLSEGDSGAQLTPSPVTGEDYLLSRLRTECSAKTEHQDTHTDKKYDTSCRACREHLHKRVDAQINLERFWGSDVMQPTIEKAFTR